VFLEIFQKLPGGPSKPPGDSCYFLCISGFLRGTAWWLVLVARRRMSANPIFGFSYERPSGDEHSPGDASHMGSILVFLGSWSVSNRERRELTQGLIVRC